VRGQDKNTKRFGKPEDLKRDGVVAGETVHCTLYPVP